MDTRQLPFLTAGLLFVVALIWLAVPGAAKIVATPIFLLAAGCFLVAGLRNRGS